VIKLRAVGDVVLSTIVLENIRRAFPSARLDVLTETASAEIVRTHPAVSSGLVYDRASMSGWELIRLVRKNRYDLIFDLFGARLSDETERGTDKGRPRFCGRTYAYTPLVLRDIHPQYQLTDALDGRHPGGRLGNPPVPFR
jgi:ADP-heptose:LPS heptosyltransferase